VFPIGRYQIMFLILPQTLYLSLGTGGQAARFPAAGMRHAESPGQMVSTAFLNVSMAFLTIYFISNVRIG